LVTTAIGEHWAIPIAETMYPTRFLQNVEARPQIQMVSIAQNDIGVDIIFVQKKVSMYPFHRTRRANRHENRGLNATVRSINHTSPCFGERIFML
jgi:hypothetical protein